MQENKRSLIEQDALRVIAEIIGNSNGQGSNNNGEGVRFSKEEIERVQNGVDLKIDNRPEDKYSGFLYEHRCFKAITTNDPNSIILGPVLLDFLLPQFGLTKWVARPDALKFETNDNNWRLKALYEFKNTKKRMFYKKLEGFEKLLEVFRQKPTLLRSMIFPVIGGVVDVPTVIDIPQNRDIFVYFVSPFRPSLPPVSSVDSFPVIYKYVQNSKI